MRELNRDDNARWFARMMQQVQRAKKQLKQYIYDTINEKWNNNVH